MHSETERYNPFFLDRSRGNLYRSRKFCLISLSPLRRMEAMSFAARGGAPTLLDVARAAGVSRTTVSNAFNRPDQLSAELRQRVLATARELGYAGPNPMARMLRTGRAGAIGVVFSERLPYNVTDPASVALLEGIAQVCDQEDAALLILSAVDEEAARRVVSRAA